MPVAVPLIIGGLSAAGALGGAAISANASKTAASEQVQASDNALDYTKQAEAPFLSLGDTSAAALQEAITNGTFGPGSLPSFSAPTLAQAEQTPGYQFEEQQGQLGLSRQAAAAGGAFTGGTLKAGDLFNTNLAQTTYQTQFANALSGYQAQLAQQAQEYQQLYTPTALGSAAASGTSANVANLMTGIGNAQAAGTVGSANAINAGISGATNSAANGLLLSQYFGGTNAPPPTPVGWSGTGTNATPPSAGYVPPDYIPPAATYAPPG